MPEPDYLEKFEQARRLTAFNPDETIDQRIFNQQDFLASRASYGRLHVFFFGDTP